MVTTETRVDFRTKGPDVLATWMVFRGMTVRRLAALVGTSPATIGKLRSGNTRTVNPALARKIARELDAPQDEIFESVSSIVQRERPNIRSAS